MPLTWNALAWVVAGIAAAVTFFVAWRAWRARLDRLSTQLQQTDHRLSIALQLNHELAEARDEKSLVEAALSAINRLASGLGISFVPFDAWGQPLPAFTIGELPRPVLEGWAEHLVSEQVRNRCSQCKTLHSPSGTECPLKVGPLGGTMAIYCFPLTLNGRSLGVVNLYLPGGMSLQDELHQFIDSLLLEVALAVETVRMRNQEVATLRQLHHLQSTRSDLIANLQAHFDTVRNTVNVAAIMLLLRPMVNERLSGLRVLSGDPGCDGEAAIERLAQATFTGEDHASGETNAASSSWAPFPLTLPEGQVLGALLVRTGSPDRLSPAQTSVLQTLAAQAALMVEYERQTLSLEYAIIIHERNRLAREIHDGLAQTLAYLKIQAVQMQTSLNLGDTNRLNRLLAENKQVLADAYQDIRQAIDNLRIHPDSSMRDWLELLADAFTRNSGVPVELEILVEQADFLPETQAQMVRIVQESLNNVRKHANAQQVKLLLREWSGQLILEVIDDGQGFDPLDVPAIAQHGLRGMHERAELIGADFQIISQPRIGTTMRLTLPLQLREVNE